MKPDKELKPWVVKEMHSTQVEDNFNTMDKNGYSVKHISTSLYQDQTYYQVVWKRRTK